MINPEHNDLRALAMGAIAPCVSAPWWEEVGTRPLAARFVARSRGLAANPVERKAIAAHDNERLCNALH